MFEVRRDHLGRHLCGPDGIPDCDREVVFCGDSCTLLRVYGPHVVGIPIRFQRRGDAGCFFRNRNQ
jgi:hypothetical protein